MPGSMKAACVMLALRLPTLTDPVRGLVTVFFATVIVTLASPTFALDGTLRKLSIVDATHAHVDGADTARVALPPRAGIGTLDGEIPVTQVVPAACATVTVCPAMLTLPVRVPPVLGARAMVTWPASVPVAPPARLMKLLWGVALHVQFDPDVTRTLIAAVPPADSNDAAVGLTLNVHGDGGGAGGGGGVPAARCVSVSVAPATTSADDRAPVLVFASRFTCTVPLPLPLLPWTIVANASLLVAVQAQPAVVVTVIEADPALADRSLRPLLETE